jgi:hypothetical protein
MAYLYFDESIRDAGGFIIGALIVTKADLSPVIRDRWNEIGLNPDVDEYKSHALKHTDSTTRSQRAFLAEQIYHCRLALTVCAVNQRRQLGQHCVSLVKQLGAGSHLDGHHHRLFIDQNIHVPAASRAELNALTIDVNVEQDSRLIAGLQLADHAAHALGGMLLEKMGVLRKLVRVGENSGYHPDEKIELGFELWAGLRHAIIGKNEHIPGMSPPPEDPANPFFRVDGHGLYIPEDCGDDLAQYARQCFGINYLGCIH